LPRVLLLGVLVTPAKVRYGTMAWKGSFWPVSDRQHATLEDLHGHAKRSVKSRGPDIR